MEIAAQENKKKWEWMSDVADRELESGTMSKKTKFRYYIVFLLFSVVLMEVLLLMPSDSETPVNAYDFASVILYSVVTLFCAFYFYKKYKGRVSFIEKSIILGVAVIPKTIVYAIPLFLITSVISVEFHSESKWSYLFDILSFMIIPQLLYYFFLSKYFVTRTSEN